MRRVVIPELLDSDTGTTLEIENTLADLRRINHWFGGVSTTAALLRRVAERAKTRELRVLDVGAGPGEAVLDAKRSLASDGLAIHVYLLDRASTHLPRNGVPTLVGDALALPFMANTFDVVTCSLFVHHLEPDQVTAFVNEALRVTRLAVVLNDLERAAAHLALVYAGFPLFRSPMTRHDAVASVRRAYTEPELRKMLSRTSSERIDITRHFLYRLGVIAWKASNA